MFSEPIGYREIGVRIYAIKLVEPYEWDFAGVRCHIDYDEQVIYLNAALPEDEQADVLAHAVHRALRRCCGWRMVPLVGKIS